MYLVALKSFSQGDFEQTQNTIVFLVITQQTDLLCVQKVHQYTVEILTGSKVAVGATLTFGEGYKLCSSSMCSCLLPSVTPADREGVVGIATCYGLDGPGNELQWREIFRSRPHRP